MQVQKRKLNDLLYPGPSLICRIFDIIIRLCFKKIVLIADIRQAFLNIVIRKEDIDLLRFLFFDKHDNSKILTYRFKRGCFGVTNLPFMMCATIQYHMNCLKREQPDLVKLIEQFRRDLYMEDVGTAVDDYVKGVEFYDFAKTSMASGSGIQILWQVLGSSLGSGIQILWQVLGSSLGSGIQILWQVLGSSLGSGIQILWQVLGSSLGSGIQILWQVLGSSLGSGIQILWQVLGSSLGSGIQILWQVLGSSLGSGIQILWQVLGSSLGSGIQILWQVLGSSLGSGIQILLS